MYKPLTFFSLVYFFILINSGCKEAKKNNSIAHKIPEYFHQFDSNYYNLQLFPSRDVACEIIKDRGRDVILHNFPFVVDTSNPSHLKSTLKGIKFHTLWVCNLPHIFNHSDTILVSGVLYSSYGDEKLSGRPTVIYKLLVRKEYITRVY